MEFPGLYGDLQTGFEPIKFLDTRSVWVGHVITTDTNSDVILSSPDDELFQIVILFLVSAQYISSSLKNRITEHLYPDSQVISQQDFRCISAAHFVLTS